MIDDEQYLRTSLKRLELDEENINYELYLIDEELKNIDKKYESLKEKEKFKLIQKFQYLYLDLEETEKEIADLKIELNIHDDEIENFDDSKNEETGSSVLNISEDIIKQLQKDRNNEF